MDDNEMLMRDGAYYQEPVAQIKEKQIQRSKVKSAIPLLEDLIERFNGRVAFYSSIDSITTDITEHPEIFQQEVMANKLVRQLMQSEKEYLESLVELYK